MAPIGMPMAPEDTMEIESDFQDWTAELDVVNKKYNAQQAAADATHEATIAALESQIQADADGLFANFHTYMQQCLQNMRQEMNASVSRQVQHRLQIEKAKVDFEAQRRQRSEEAKKQVVNLFDKHHFPASTRKRDTIPTFTGQSKPSPQLHTKASHLQSTLNGHSSKTSSPAPATADLSLNGGSVTDGRSFGEVFQGPPQGPVNHSTSPTPGAAQFNRESLIDPEHQANTADKANTADSWSVASFRSPTPSPDPSDLPRPPSWPVPPVNSGKGVDPHGSATSKRKGDVFISGPADTAKRARKELPGDKEHVGPAEIQRPTTPQRPSRPAAAQRTISFAEVYQDGQAEHKHNILEYIEGSGKFYILKCDEHHVHFGNNPLAGAAKHLFSTQHNKLPKTHEMAIEKLGYLVYDCTRELADKNNACFSQALRNGYEPFNANRLTKAEKAALDIEITESPSFHQETSMRKSRGPESVEGTPGSDKQFKGITDAKYGNLYLGYWAKTKQKFPVIVLPLGDLKAAGLKGKLLETSLKKTIPRCYVVTRPTPDTKVISGWAKGYEDGGPLVTKREFPVMYFDDKSLVGWIPARHLSNFDFDDPNPNPYPGYYGARDYWARIQDDGCSGYLDWIARGSIRNPTESPPPSSNAEEVNPAAGSEAGTTGPTTSYAEMQEPTNASDENLDEEMIDFGEYGIDATAETHVPLADNDRPAEAPAAETHVPLVDNDRPAEAPAADIVQRNEEFVEPMPLIDALLEQGSICNWPSVLTNCRTTSSMNAQIVKELERPGGVNTFALSVITALSSQTARKSALADLVSRNRGTTKSQKASLAPRPVPSIKPSESAPRPLSIPTPLTSTEVSPITAGSPVLAAPSSSAPPSNSTAQEFAARALNINSTHRVNSPVNVIDLDQPRNRIPSRGSDEPTRLETIGSARSSQDRSSMPAIPLNGRERSAQAGAPASITMRSPPAESVIGRQQNHMQTYITGSPKPSPRPEHTTNVSKAASRGATPTVIRETIESAQGASPMRNTMSPRREASTNGPEAPLSIPQTRSPVVNGGTANRLQHQKNPAQLPPRPADRLQTYPNFAHVPPHLVVGSSAPPPARPGFASAVEQPQSTIFAKSASPSLGPYRSASSTPTPASEVTSRKGTPTIVRGDSLDRWKAVHKTPSFSQPPHASYVPLGSTSENSRGPSIPQDRRGFSLSSIMGASAAGQGLNKPESTPSGKEQYFDVIGYQDSTDTNIFVKGDNSPFLRVTVDAVRGIAETAAGEAIAVSINPLDVLTAVVKNVDQDQATVALTLRDPNSRPEYWYFGTKSTGAQPVSGKIQARRFCQWIRKMNPHVQYENRSVADSSRQSSAGRSPFLD